MRVALAALFETRQDLVHAGIHQCGVIDLAPVLPIPIDAQGLVRRHHAPDAAQPVDEGALERLERGAHGRQQLLVAHLDAEFLEELALLDLVIRLGIDDDAVHIEDDGFEGKAPWTMMMVLLNPLVRRNGEGRPSRRYIEKVYRDPMIYCCPTYSGLLN